MIMLYWLQQGLALSVGVMMAPLGHWLREREEGRDG